VTIARVVDGDTVELADGTKVRLIGMNTPETVDPRREVQAYGKESSDYTKQLLGGQEVFLEEGRTPRDKYGRTLAWPWLPDGRFVNALLVQEGYAQVYTFSDNPENAGLLVACQQEARTANRGLWALPDYEDGQEAAKQGLSQSAAPPPPAAAEPASPAQQPAPAGVVTITKAPGSVARGAMAAVAVSAPPGVSCSITVRYKSGNSTAQGLEPKQTGADGSAAWTWKVGQNTSSGTWPVTVTCAGQSAGTSVTVP
jgi:endonuclease YncB( thermonuclease family)